MKRRDFMSAALVLGGALWTPRALGADEDLAVIVHTASPIRGISREELRAIFTTRMRSWDDGTKLIPLNFAPRDPQRVLFDRIVLGMEPDEVGRFWIDRKVRGGNPPPKHVPNVKIMRGAVAKLRGAIGYLPVASVGDAVRIVARVKEGKLVV